MDNPRVKIELYDNNTVRMWIDGEEIEDLIEVNFFAAVDKPENHIKCHYWKHSRTEGGKLLVLNNEIITEKVTIE